MGEATASAGGTDDATKDAPTKSDSNEAGNVSRPASPHSMAGKCLPILQKLLEQPQGWVFRDAVDPDLYNLPDYFEIVKNSMHLSLIKKKLEDSVYIDMAQFKK